MRKTRFPHYSSSSALININMHMYVLFIAPLNIESYIKKAVVGGDTKQNELHKNLEFNLNLS